MMRRDWLVEKRLAKKMKQYEVAQEIGITKSYLSDIEHGKKTPSGATALKISQLLDVPMEDFYKVEEMV